MKRMIFCNSLITQLILPVLLCLTVSFSFSQTDTSANKKVIVDTKISVGGAVQKGSVNLITVTSSFENTVKSKSVSSTLFLQHTYNKTFNSVIQNDVFSYGIVSHREQKRFYPKISGMYEKSKIKSIDNRTIFGAGMGWNLLMKPKYKLTFINSLAYEKTDFSINNSLNYDGFRYSGILKGTYVLLEKKLILKHTLFFHPLLFNTPNNYRYRFMLASILPLSKKISAKVTLDYSKESIVDSGYKPENILTTFGLSINF